MIDPMIYILAPFGLAFGLFVVYLIVSLFLKDPARPFRMFKAPPIEDSPKSRVQSPEEEDDGSKFRIQDSKEN